MACHRFYFAPYTSRWSSLFFSMFDSCARSTDFSELDVVRTGQNRSAESRKKIKSGVTGKQIRSAGKRVLEGAREGRARSYAEAPAARHQRKRVLEDAGEVLEGLESMKRKKQSVGGRSKQFIHRLEC